MDGFPLELLIMFISNLFKSGEIVIVGVLENNLARA
jgi:hypothetical protein